MSAVRERDAATLDPALVKLAPLAVARIRAVEPLEVKDELVPAADERCAANSV